MKLSHEQPCNYEITIIFHVNKLLFDIKENNTTDSAGIPFSNKIIICCINICFVDIKITIHLHLTGNFQYCLFK